MNKVLALSAMSLVALPAFGQEVVPFEVGYQWSLSGKQYVTANRPLKYWNDKLSFDAVAGYELTTGAQPSLGFGLNYSFVDSSGFYARLGAFALFPQKARPDVGFGLTFGVRF